MDWTSQEPMALAARVANSIVLAADRFTQGVAPDYWTWTRSLHLSVVSAVADLDDPFVARLAAQLTDEPGDPRLYRAFVLALAQRFDPLGDAPAHLGRRAWEADSACRLWVHVGDRFRADGSGAGFDPPHTAAGPHPLLTGLTRPAHDGRDPVDAAIVIPFRDRDPASNRARNLAATLNALNDQTYPRERYRIVVVEADRAPRWRDRFGPACDTYLFGYNPGLFNKSWAVNVGVIHGAQPAATLCILDADLLVDRHFVERNVTRFQSSAVQGHWPFHDLLFLDEESSRLAIQQRCVEGRKAVDFRGVRGVFLRRPPGGCLWLREGLFTRVGGMDERFEGWGGEDLDLVWRVELYGGLDRHADPLVHLHHARAPHRDCDGTPFYREIKWCSWPCDSPIGELAKYVADRQ